MILIISIYKEKLHYYEFVRPVCDILDENRIKYFVRNYKEVKKKDLKKCSKVIICGTSLYDNEFLKKENSKYFDWLLNFDRPILGICGGMQVIGLVFGEKLKKKIEKSKSFLEKKTDKGKSFFKKKIEKSKSFLEKKTEIGFFKEEFIKDFLGLIGEKEVYHLHNYFIDFKKLRDFAVFNTEQKVNHHLQVMDKALALSFRSVSPSPMQTSAFKLRYKSEGLGNKGSITQAVRHKEKEIYGVLFHPEVRQKDLIKNFCLLIYERKFF